MGKRASMSDLKSAFAAALALIVSLDQELTSIIFLSLRISLTASLLAFAFAAQLGVALAIYRFTGRGILVVLANSLMGLPPVVLGLAVYLLLSRMGPLGGLGWLFTPAAMVLAQTMLCTPIVVAIVHRVSQTHWLRYGDSLLMSGASKLRSIPVLMTMAREGLVTAFLSAFGRAIAEVGAIIIVGGNIRGYTRTMTTAIVLETSRGDLPLALGLGLILITISIAVSATTLVFARSLQR
jgi:tungstate transport system permease protein